MTKLSLTRRRRSDFLPCVPSCRLENAQEFEILSKEEAQSNMYNEQVCQTSHFLQSSEEFVFLLFHSDLGKCMALLLKAITKTKMSEE